MEKSDCIKLMSFFLERHLLRLLVDEGTLTAEEYAGILQIAQTPGNYVVILNCAENHWINMNSCDMLVLPQGNHKTRRSKECQT